MKNSANDNVASPRFIENNVFALLETTKARSEQIAITPNTWLLSNEAKAIRKKR